MGIVAKYRFDPTIYADYMPEFNSDFYGYYVSSDVKNDDGTITRTIECYTTPTTMMFGQLYNAENDNATPKSLSLLEVYEMDLSTVTHISSMFRKCEKLTAIHCQFNCNFNIVTDTQEAFRSCSSLTSLDVSNFTTEKVTTMQNMFNGCSSLTSLDLSNFNTENVKNMNWMFYGCSSLTSLDVSNFNTENVTTMQGMFYNCSSLTSLGTSNFNTENVTTMQGMFQNCPLLISLDVSNFNTKNTTNMSWMFHNCSSLTSLDVSNFNTENVKDMSGIFQGCSSLTSLDVSNFNTEKVTAMQGVFYNCSLITSLDVSNFNTEKVTTMDCMFYNCSSLTSLDVSSFNTENVTDMTAIFNGCSSLTSLDVSNFNTEKTTIMQNMFNNCSSLTSLDLSNFNTENVNNMNWMFYNCSLLTYLDVSNFNTENVTTMQGMFQNCPLLISLDVSNFNTEKVTDMGWMFQNCFSLTSLDVSNFNTENVTAMNTMFYGCSSLTSLDVSNFNTKNVTAMYQMFQNCSSLTSLDLSNFNTENVTTMYNMFIHCSSLTSLDLSNFKTENVTSMNAMFENCSSLTSLDLSNFNTENVTTMNVMFKNCKSLTNIGTIYCNLSTINKISSLITTNTKIYYSLPDISELESHDNIEYIKYIFPTKIQLPPHIQLHSLPDGTCDELDIKTGILTRRIGKRVLNGSEDWVFATTKTLTQVFSLSLKEEIINYDEVSLNMYCSDNDYQIKSGIEDKTISSGWGYIYLQTLKTDASTMDELRTYLLQNPITVYYELATPITVKLILNYNNSCNYGVILPRSTSDNYNVITNEYKQNLDFIPIDGSIAFDSATTKDTTVKFSVALSKFEIDTTNVRGSDGIYCDNNLFKYETSDNDYEHAYIENDTTLHIYVNKSRLNSYDQVGFQLYLNSNPFNVYYAMRTPIVSYVNYEDLDPEKANWEMLDCTEDGSITIESENMDKTLLLDCMDYVAPTKNRFEIDLLKANTQYTVYAEGISGTVQLNFGGNIVNFRNGNIYTSGETQLVEFYTNNEIKNLIIIEGDTRTETIEFFEGLKSSENVTVISTNAPFVFGKGGKIQ